MLNNDKRCASRQLLPNKEINIKTGILITVSAILGMAASNALADGMDKPMFKFSGFATLGISHSTENRGDYVVDSTIPKGAGLSNSWAFGNDTRLGGQVSAEFSPRVSGVLQVISEYQANSTWSPRVEWANLKYSFTPDFYVRAGRIALPTFMHSDTRKVGYSYPWVHPPTELYRQLAITNSDGVDAMYRFGIGEASNKIRVVYSSNRIDRPASTSTSRNMWGIFDTLEYGATLIHGGFQERESSFFTSTTGVTGPWVRNTDLSLGASYDPGKWFVMGSWIQRVSTSKRGAMYVSGGYRHGEFTPYLTYSQDSRSSFLPGVVPTANQLALALRSQHTTSVGTRWNFRKNTDLTVQYDTVQLGPDSNGDMANVPAGVTLYGSRFHVFTATLDFVF